MSEEIKLSAKIERRVKERDKLALTIQADIDKLAEDVSKLIDHDLKTYGLLSKPDTLYYDSPISRAFTFEWIKQHMIKKDMDFIGFHLDGKASIMPFMDRTTEASRWIMRFCKEVEPEKKGLEAIL